jgi:hypothetical protein
MSDGPQTSIGPRTQKDDTVVINRGPRPRRCSLSQVAPILMVLSLRVALGTSDDLIIIGVQLVSILCDWGCAGYAIESLPALLVQIPASDGLLAGDCRSDQGPLRGFWQEKGEPQRARKTQKTSR